MAASLLVLSILLGLIGCGPKPSDHGTAYLIGIDTNQLAATDNLDDVLRDRQKVLSKRLKKLGVLAFFEPLPGARLLVKVANSYQIKPDEVWQSLAMTGRLEFRMVHPESDQLVAAGIVEPGYEILRQQVKQADGFATTVAYLVNKQPERGLTGKYIKRAMVTRHHLTGEPEIAFELDPKGAKIFEEVTTQYSPKGNKFFHLAIVLDGRLYSAPRILGPIPGGRGQITGNFDLKEAFAFANVMENPVEPPHRILETKSF